MRIVCDFDGTITRADTVDAVLEQLADPRWRDLEAQWMANEITAAACMRGQVALIDPSEGRLEAVLDQVELDPDFTAFVDWCEARGHEIAVVSDGVDYFIHKILARHGLDRLPVIANRLIRGQAFALDQPWSKPGCAASSGVCKCAAARQDDRGLLIYVGDGRSDFCVSADADILFAKASLAAYAAGRGQAFHPYETFDDVTRTLSRLLEPQPVALATRLAS